jgi:glutaredoxin 2
MELFVYEHCPFSMRPRVIAGLQNIDCKITILNFADKQTPINYIGKKICPFLVLDDGSTKTESLDLAYYLDSLGEKPILSNKSIDPKCEELIRTYLKSIIAITVPKYLELNYPEFSSQEAIDLYVSREEAYLGHSFNMNEYQKKFYIKQVNTFLAKSSQFTTSKTPEKSLTPTELILFAYLRNIRNTGVIKLSNKTDGFVTTIAHNASVKLY